MVSIIPKVFLVGGSDFLSRQKAVESIKKKILKEKAGSLHTVIFYSKEIDIKLLQERIATFSFSGDKIIIFKDAYNLAKNVKDYLENNLEAAAKNNYLVFEIEEDYSKFKKDKKIISDSFFSTLFKKASVYNISSSEPKKVSVEDFKWSVRKGELSSSIYILEKIFEQQHQGRELGPQLLGIIISELSVLRHPFYKRENFAYLWAADREIKEKGMDTRLVIQRLLVKLFAKK